MTTPTAARHLRTARTALGNAHTALLAQANQTSDQRQLDDLYTMAAQIRQMSETIAAMNR